jgi:hypothetical protein
MKDQLTLAQLSTKLDHYQNQIELFFKTVNTSDALKVSTDEYFGKRSINIFVRLDEFSITKLEEALPKLKNLFSEYLQLRKLEATELNRVAVEKAIQNQVDPSKGLY